MPEASGEGPLSYELQRGEIHVWKFALAGSHAEVAEIMDPLSQAEKDRASRCRFEKDQARFISGRATLRLLLSRYTETAPEKITFRYEAQGKPMLADGPEWQFNLSHSRDRAVLAIARESPVGIDMERIDPEFPCNEVAAEIFSDEELRHLHSLEPAEQFELFFQVWTSKEALLKAVGKGFSIEPKSIQLRIASGLPVEIAAAPADFDGVTLHRLSLEENFEAALAVFTEGSRIECFDFKTAY